MLCNIHIQELRIHAYHGVMQQERQIGADFVVTIDAEVEVAHSAYADDRLDGTVSYADIIDTVKQQMAIPSNLLEHVAHRVASELINTFPQVQQVSVRIDKDNPPCGVSASAIGVELTLDR